MNSFDSGSIYSRLKNYIKLSLPLHLLSVAEETINLINNYY